MICLPQSHQISDLRMKLHWEDFILNSPTSWICSVDISTLDFRFLSTHSTSHQICQRIFKAKLELKLQLKKKKKRLHSQPRLHVKLSPPILNISKSQRSAKKHYGFVQSLSHQVTHSLHKGIVPLPLQGKCFVQMFICYNP